MTTGCQVAETTDRLESEGFDVTLIINRETRVGYTELEDPQDATADDQIRGYMNSVHSSIGDC